MQNGIKVSIIVPIYKVEKYLRKCIDSLINQTEKNIEIILVDDGSPDNCPKIADEYKEKYPKLITVLHIENGGQGNARNIGVSIAKGEYILFVDSDDYVEKNMVELLYNEANNSADIVIFAHNVVFEDGRLKNVSHENLQENKNLNLHQNKELLHISAAPWNRLIKREILLNNESKFPLGVWYEDIRVTTKWFTKANNIRYINKPLYNYVIREGSTVNNKNAEKNRDILTAFDDILSYFKEQKLFDEFKEELEFLTVFHIYLTASVRVIMIDKRSVIIKEFIDYTNSHFPNWKNNKYLNSLDSNKKLILKLLEKNRFSTIRLIFSLKNKLKK